MDIMDTAIKNGLIEPADLAALLENSNVKLVNATWGPRHPVRIGNAVPFDIDAIADQGSILPHMLPAPDDFSAAAAALGISSDDFVVVYDQSGIASAAARVWWTFRVFGHDRVCVLDGGLPAWADAGFPLARPDASLPAPGRFTAQFRPALVADMNDVHAALENDTALVLDARSAERFAGIAPEPRPNLRGGHMPGSVNLPFPAVIDPDTGRLALPALLDRIFAGAGNPHQHAGRIITSCGSGVTACVLALALFRMGKTDVAVYDGSWAEWGRESSGTPVARTG